MDPQGLQDSAKDAHVASVTIRRRLKFGANLDPMHCPPIGLAQRRDLN